MVCPTRSPAEPTLDRSITERYESYEETTLALPIPLFLGSGSELNWPEECCWPLVSQCACAILHWHWNNRVQQKQQLDSFSWQFLGSRSSLLISSSFSQLSELLQEFLLELDENTPAARRYSWMRRTRCDRSNLELTFSPSQPDSRQFWMRS